MPELTSPARQRSGSLACSRPPPLCVARTAQQEDREFCRAIGGLAVRCLYAELSLYPKPGLVSLVDSGSHQDMNAQTFMRSLFSLRHYFIRVTAAGFRDASFETLKWLGMEAERRMLAATVGINTHRGAIFCLGMLCAAIGRCRAQLIPLSAEAIRAALLLRWGEALAEHTRSVLPRSHGQRATATHAIAGARQEAAQGLPSIFEVALPALRRTVAAGRGHRSGCIDALFSLMAHIDDTNVYHRGGIAGAQFVKRCAREFLALGGTGHPGWYHAALACHRSFVEQRLSPGGAADLLAATCFVHQVTRRFKQE